MSNKIIIRQRIDVKKTGISVSHHVVDPTTIYHLERKTLQGNVRHYINHESEDALKQSRFMIKNPDLSNIEKTIETFVKTNLKELINGKEEN